VGAPAALDFGVVALEDRADTQLALFHNRGPAALVLAGVGLVGPHPGDFLLVSPRADEPRECQAGVTLLSGEVCGIGVRFAPALAGLRQATLQVTLAAALSPGVVALGGSGYASARGDLAAGFPRVRDGDAGGRSHDLGQGLLSAADGHLWVTGYSTDASGRWAPYLWKLDAHGVPVAGFPRLLEAPAAAGVGNGYGQALAQDAGGDVWAIGTRFDGLGSFELLLSRLDAQGQPRVGFPRLFGSEAAGRRQSYGEDLALDPDGLPWVAGRASNGHYVDLGLWQFTAAGSLQPGFPLFDYGLEPISQGAAYGMAISADGFLWVVGHVVVAGNRDFALWKYSTAGVLQRGFPKVRAGDAGGVGDDSGLGVALSPDGRIWATGYSVNARGDKDFVLWCFDSDGTLDPGFPVIRDADAGGPGHDEGRALAVDPGGTVWVTGSSTRPAGDADFALWRFRRDGSPAPGFPLLRHGDAGGAGHDEGRDLGLGPGGAVWVVGSSGNDRPDNDLVIWKFE
jgi:uncharacterized delta-60 repeat protein